MLRILAVDDEVVIRDLVKRTLSLGNYEICLAAEGREALAEVERQKPDLLLLDLCLDGDLDGLEICQALKTRYGAEAPKVVLLTGNDQEGVREACFEAGACAFLTKPFSPLELIDQIETILEYSDAC